MDQATGLEGVPAIDEALFERAWRLAFGARGGERLAVPVQDPFLASMHRWHTALELLQVPESRRMAYDQRFVALAVSLCREASQPCCVSVDAVRSACR